MAVARRELWRTHTNELLELLLHKELIQSAKEKGFQRNKLLKEARIKKLSRVKDRSQRFREKTDGKIAKLMHVDVQLQSVTGDLKQNDGQALAEELTNNELEDVVRGIYASRSPGRTEANLKRKSAREVVREDTFRGESEDLQRHHKARPLLRVEKRQGYLTAKEEADSLRSGKLRRAQTGEVEEEKYRLITTLQSEEEIR
ncbi:unnamed protein product [Eruca vesicaria subsp. sativa]|uniref:Uncharacterized protein n=1 Tax=Eruca vesicaria subsp. sativa TaxID=29727 RepID=A0ABC8JBI8_ERUVS|nr:unnamed protein product [Eruca vesicaria subsp. sativa]